MLQPLLDAGTGNSGNCVESGTLLINRHRWLAALHWVMWINTWHERVYQRFIHGDKDTFSLGFALAGAAEKYMQVRRQVLQFLCFVLCQNSANVCSAGCCEGRMPLNMTQQG